MCREHGKKKRFYCTVEGCTFGTNSKDPIYDHMYSAHKINVGAKPVLECKHCDYSTVRMHSFKKHQSCHGPQEYNVKCIIEGCDKAFRDDKGLRNHYRNCHVDMSLNCRYCDGIFRTPQKLRAHEEIMHTKRVRNFKCAYCNHATVQRTNCRTHIKNSHRGLPITVINLEKIGVVPQPEPPISGRGADYRPESPWFLARTFCVVVVVSKLWLVFIKFSAIRCVFSFKSGHIVHLVIWSFLVIGS